MLGDVASWDGGNTASCKVADVQCLLVLTLQEPVEDTTVSGYNGGGLITFLDLAAGPKDGFNDKVDGQSGGNR